MWKIEHGSAAGSSELQQASDELPVCRQAHAVSVVRAGKTTLMDVLACRKTFGRSTGDVRVNGFPQQPGAFARVSGYVEQEDVHSPQVRLNMPAESPYQGEHCPS